MFWQITDEDILAARNGNAAAIERVYIQALEPCYRIAMSISGRQDVAHAVLKTLIRRSTEQLQKWDFADEASAWFMHHTIILLREYRKPIPPQHDLLLRDIEGPDVVQYQALVNALRKLPEQQQEAFILFHAQRWNTRLCAVAMDCSNTAVETHVSESNRQIQPLLGQNFSALIGFLQQVHRALPLDLPTPPKLIATSIKVRRSTRFLVRITGWILIFALVALILMLAVFIFPRIET